MAKQRVRSRDQKYRSPKSHRPNPKNGVKKRTIKKSNFPTKPRKSEGRRVQDARQTLLGKKRKPVVDARDIIKTKSKVQDARTKINRIRDDRSTAPSSSGSVKVIGHSILKKTDRNGRISLTTNKSKPRNDLNVAIQKQLGLIPPNRSPTKRPAPKRNAAVNTSRASRSPPRVHKSIMREPDYEPREPVRLYDPTLYKWTKPELRNTASQMINSLEVTRQAMREALREELIYGWPTYASHKTSRLQPSTYIDLDAVDDEEMPMAPPPRANTVSLQGTSRVTNVHSRLDEAVPSESHGIFSANKTKVVVPAGHRIVVSNLQQTVTQDDIKELFEDIGQLLTAKLVRPGVAEVVYKNLKDAQKAVDTYHNRQLDGQPMKCLLVNKRPLNYPTAAPISKPESMTASRKISEVAPCPPENKLVPDITTIHKVLFHRK
ncbi:polymerase delta-interacting protein 3 isoform X2 [Diabrotica virgifera virgifera]|uniref:RRM domain-containing protein n=1 Tax=Diabrotica virgifera virgifera TaxID=50390 RepID=A0ABM5KAK6_DIAVI|nr:polymerase delta-interacting protein 3 isoform X2 [Diabrotica virgifera virgifera]